MALFSFGEALRAKPSLEQLAGVSFPEETCQTDNDDLRCATGELDQPTYRTCEEGKLKQSFIGAIEITHAFVCTRPGLYQLMTKVLGQKNPGIDVEHSRGHCKKSFSAYG